MLPWYHVLRKETWPRIYRFGKIQPTFPYKYQMISMTLTFGLLTWTSSTTLGGLIRCTYTANLSNMYGVMQRTQWNFKQPIWRGSLDMELVQAMQRTRQAFNNLCKLVLLVVWSWNGVWQIVQSWFLFVLNMMHSHRIGVEPQSGYNKT